MILLKIPDKLDCLLCCYGSLLSESEAHKCVVCGILVHELSTCYRKDQAMYREGKYSF